MDDHCRQRFSESNYTWMEERGIDRSKLGTVFRHMPLPAALNGKTYQDVVEYCLLKREITPLGLYRSANHHHTQLPYVLTNPPQDTIVKEHDKVIVLANSLDVLTDELLSPMEESDGDGWAPTAATMPQSSDSTAQSSAARKEGDDDEGWGPPTRRPRQSNDALKFCLSV